MLTLKQSFVIFGLLAAGSSAAILIYALHSKSRTQQEESHETIAISDDANLLIEARKQPHLLFRNTSLGPFYGHLMVIPLTATAGRRYPTPLVGDRVHGTTATGFLLRASRRALTTYDAFSFNERFEVLNSFKLAGAPSRTRVSPDGRMAAATVFVSGDSYNTGGFSTRTTLYDLSSGATIGSLEEFAVFKDGTAFRKADFNFWGVTFTKNHDQFYATLASGGICYLVSGNITQRSVNVVREGVECPSLSPDGNRLVFKFRLIENGRLRWQLHILNLKTEKITTVNEPRNVDDQAEWLDDAHVLYALPRENGNGRSDIWVASADGVGSPSVFVSDGSSPCVVQP